MVTNLKTLPLRDGKTHINIYSRGNTKLGRMLSNFYNSKFTSKDDGTFLSIEGYWYYLLLQETYQKQNTLFNIFDSISEEFRTFYGFIAKKRGQLLLKNLDNVEEISLESLEKIKLALHQKTKENLELQKLLIESTLPFEHYYYYGKEDNATVYLLEEYSWLPEEYEIIRKELLSQQ